MRNASKLKTYLWNNIEHFVRNYHLCLLDQLFCIKDDASKDPVVRYNDFASNFSKHFELESWSSVRHKNDYPLITTQFSDYIVNDCHIDINISFHITYNGGINPENCGSNKCQKCIADPSGWADCVADAIVKMFIIDKTVTSPDPDDDGTQISSNLFDELACSKQMIAVSDTLEVEETWKWNIKALVGSISLTPQENAGDELSTFTVSVPLRIYEMYSDRTCNCEEDPEYCGC